MLELKNVTKSFGTFKALDNLTMTVPKGSVYGLVGPNGAGKSTAIRHLTGVYTPDCGDVTMEGAPIYENPDVKVRIGCIPDEIFYFPSATLEDMRRFYAGIYPKFDQALFDRLYDIFKLPKKSPIRRFSKGMQSRRRSMGFLRTALPEATARSMWGCTAGSKPSSSSSTMPCRTPSASAPGVKEVSSIPVMLPRRSG